MIFAKTNFSETFKSHFVTTLVGREKRERWQAYKENKRQMSRYPFFDFRRQFKTAIFNMYV